MAFGLFFFNFYEYSVTGKVLVYPKTGAATKNCEHCYSQNIAICIRTDTADLTPMFCRPTF